MTKQSKIVTGVLAGAALGVAIALVLASDKDDALKEKVSDWFCDILSDSKDKLASLASTIKEKAADAKLTS